jgi:hypothetical protein
MPIRNGLYDLAGDPAKPVTAGGMDPRPPGAVVMGAPTLAGLAAAISIAMWPIAVRELSFRLFNGDQRPVTVLRPAVTENAGGYRMRGGTSKKPGSVSNSPRRDRSTAAAPACEIQLMSRSAAESERVVCSWA